jgi:hypothetical protein
MQEITKKAQENIRMKALFGGVYNSAGTQPVDIMNGLLKIVSDEITATKIAPVVTGAISNANVIDKLETVFDSLGENYKSAPSQMLVNPQIFTWYKRKYRGDFGGNNDYSGMTANQSINLDGTMCTIKAEPGLGTSQRTICTTQENLIYGVDSIGEENDIKTQIFERTIKLMIDAKSGVEISDIDGDCFVVNDQA